MRTPNDYPNSGELMMPEAMARELYGDPEREEHFVNRFSADDAEWNPWKAQPSALFADVRSPETEEKEFYEGLAPITKLFADSASVTTRVSDVESFQRDRDEETREAYGELEPIRKLFAPTPAALISFQKVSSQPTENPAVSDWDAEIIPTPVAKTDPQELAKRAASDAAVKEQTEAQKAIRLQEWIIREVEKGVTVDDLVDHANDAEIGSQIRQVAEALGLI
jgi:hypothetical protein